MIAQKASLKANEYEFRKFGYTPEMHNRLARGDDEGGLSHRFTLTKHNCDGGGNSFIDNINQG